LFTAARETLISFNFVDPVIGHGTDDAAQYAIRLASGPRAIRVVFDRQEPAHMRFDRPLAEGLRVLNRISGELRPEYYFHFYPERLSPQRRVQRPAAGREPVPGLSADWSSVSLEFVSQDGRFAARVYNPNDNPNDRYQRGYNERGHKRPLSDSRNDMEISIRENDAVKTPEPRAVAISDADRKSFFEDIRVILNQFELHDPKEGEDEGEVRCFVRIDGCCRDLEVEFKLNDALSDDWRVRISRILEIGHRHDKAFPTIRDLTRSDPLERSAP
jgi:hypothetical protein